MRRLHEGHEEIQHRVDDICVTRQGYHDQNALADGSTRDVPAYVLWDLSGSYKFSKAFSLRAGIKNLLDTNPPRSNQVYSFIAGYDPSYTAPRGRFVYISANYSFK
ncbi:TonB-dependent receptor domain-containing protein [Undibacterium sp. JH2W]|uniref:TonB-dependent receptor domain-containing protein n=1 Tax=Undibacterium sp. JH2W TaxID=3413037 RepID=UPI003BF1BDBA